MKKPVVAPGRPVQEKSPRKASLPKTEREKMTPFRKPFEPVTNASRPARPNAHDPVDDEFPVPNVPDKEAGKDTPSQEPW